MWALLTSHCAGVTLHPFIRPPVSSGPKMGGALGIIPRASRRLVSSGNRFRQLHRACGAQPLPSRTRLKGSDPHVYAVSPPMDDNAPWDPSDTREGSMEANTTSRQAREPSIESADSDGPGQAVRATDDEHSVTPEEPSAACVWDSFPDKELYYRNYRRWRTANRSFLGHRVRTASDREVSLALRMQHGPPVAFDVLEEWIQTPSRPDEAPFHVEDVVALVRSLVVEGDPHGRIERLVRFLSTCRTRTLGRGRQEFVAALERRMHVVAPRDGQPRREPKRPRVKANFAAKARRIGKRLTASVTALLDGSTLADHVRAQGVLRAQRTARALAALDASWDECVGESKARAVAQRRSVLQRWKARTPHSATVLVATAALKTAAKARRHAAFAGGRAAAAQTPPPADDARPSTGELQRCAREHIAAQPNRIVRWGGPTQHCCAAGAVCKRAGQHRGVGYIGPGDVVVVRPMVGPTARDGFIPTVPSYTHFACLSDRAKARMEDPAKVAYGRSAKGAVQQDVQRQIREAVSRHVAQQSACESTPQARFRERPREARRHAKTKRQLERAHRRGMASLRKREASARDAAVEARTLRARLRRLSGELAASQGREKDLEHRIERQGQGLLAQEIELKKHEILTTRAVAFATRMATLADEAQSAPGALADDAEDPPYVVRSPSPGSLACLRLWPPAPPLPPRQRPTAREVTRSPSQGRVDDDTPYPSPSSWALDEGDIESISDLQL
ncbi:hypothetical protein SCHPADRAFT_947024 [Schizopora paradoxa]|uniref:Uncharacterized protein n=1 Tax=Schizopora paradoxa TaxID=27342 RepID=A0A0H2R0T7_9AGAM|nr:hypothetical protein SCHPADRAFT_947024 [Schizopora paradoxa]